MRYSLSACDHRDVLKTPALLNLYLLWSISVPHAEDRAPRHIRRDILLSLAKYPDLASVPAASGDSSRNQDSTPPLHRPGTANTANPAKKFIIMFITIITVSVVAKKASLLLRRFQPHA